MRILLNESLPHDLAALILDHRVLTVRDEGWASVKNGKLLALASTKFDVFIEAAMDWKQHITTDPSILHGVSRFTGTRVPVTVVLDNLADGATPAAILCQYPGLRAEHLQAAFCYASELAGKRIVTLPE